MFKKLLDEKNKLITALSLITLGVISRLTFFDLLPNTPAIYIHLNGVTQPMFGLDLFFIIAVISLLSGILIGGYYTFIIPLSVMMITDLIIGNTYIFLFTWSGFLVIGIIGYLVRAKRNLTFTNFPMFLGAGIGGIIIYDIWTNFGTWLGVYSHNINSLIMCYTVALPFFLWHVLSTTILFTAVLIPVIILKEKELIKAEYTIKPFEKYTTITIAVVLMALGVITLIV